MDIFDIAITLLVFLILEFGTVAVILALQMKNKFFQVVAIASCTLLNIIISLFVMSFVSGQKATEAIPEIF